jgi:hypothetical protein
MNIFSDVFRPMAMFASSEQVVSSQNGTWEHANQHVTTQ